MKESKNRITKASQGKNSNLSSGATLSSRQRVTTRSASSAAATAAERPRTRSKPLERERDRAKVGTRPPDRDRERVNALERERPKPSGKPPMERGRTPAKPHMTKKMMNPGESGSLIGLN